MILKGLDSSKAWARLAQSTGILLLLSAIANICHDTSIYKAFCIACHKSHSHRKVRTFNCAENNTFSFFGKGFRPSKKRKGVVFRVGAVETFRCDCPRGGREVLTFGVSSIYHEKSSKSTVLQPPTQNVEPESYHWHDVRVNKLNSAHIRVQF